MFNVAEEIPRMRVVRGLALVGIAVLLVLAMVAVYVYFNRDTPPAEGELTAVLLYQPLPRVVATAAPAAVPAGNTLLLLAPIKIRNMSEKPLSVMDISGVIRLGDTDYKSYAASTLDFDRVFKYYPDLDAYRQSALIPHSQIPPGGEAQGMVVFNYALPEDQFSKAQSFEIDVTFDTIPYILHITWPTFPAHNHIAATVAPPPSSTATVAHHKTTATP
jgi:hypothetical protein